MKKTKVEKGITLIALIITIVVLLILAVVSIGAIKDSKIIEHAQNASNDYTVAQEKEQLQLALSEWQLQKNIPGNTQNFKEFISSELGETSRVSGNDDELIVKFNKTGNAYKISQDGTLGESAKLTGTTLEKYIFGDNLKGRDLTEIMDLEEMKFINNNTGKEITLLNITDEDSSETDVLLSVSFKYDNEIGMFKVIIVAIENEEGEEEEIYTTEAYYGITMLGEKVGKTVSYDGKTWTILYNDDTNGLQMISNEVYEYNGDDFYLGYDDSSITDWNSLNTETEEFKLADLNENKELDDDLEKAIYSYNTAIVTLNKACDDVVTKNDNIIDVRCVGSNPTNKNAENATLYTSDNLAKWPENDSDYSAGIGNGRGKSEDSNYVTDLSRMNILGIINANDAESRYWLASRCILSATKTEVFCIRFCIEKRSLYTNLWNVYDDEVRGWEDYYKLRPVITVNANGLQANETSTTDYILN